MTCDPTGPCGVDSDPLAVDNPAPGLARLQRRLGHYDDFLSDLVVRCEQQRLDGEPVGRAWDIEGDPQAMSLLRLWAYVAEGVAAYTESTAGEAYLSTAHDWLDLARLADQIGYRPGQRVAAEGWVRFDTDRLSSPNIPARTKTQASGTPDRAAQTFEVIADTQLDAEWADLTATWVPEPATPAGRTVRFLGDPGFRAGDDVLLIAEEQEQEQDAPSSSTSWLVWWLWLFGLADLPVLSSATPRAVVRVVGHESQLGTTLVEFDREVSGLVDTTTSYAAYRILDRASSARKLTSVMRVPATGSTAQSVGLPGIPVDAVTDTSIVLDRALSSVSTDSLVAVVHWRSAGNRGDVVTVAHHIPIEWEVAPGTPVLVSQLVFEDEVGALADGADQRDVYVLDRRVSLTHYTFPETAPTEAPGAGLQIRVWPAPRSTSPPSGRLAVQTTREGVPEWEILEVTASGDAEVDASGRTDGLILDVQTAAPVGDIAFSPASGNVAKVRHGETTSATIGSGDGVAPFAVMAVPDEPIAAELGDDGSITNSMSVRVNDRSWTELTTLFGAGPVTGYETRIGPDGEVDVRFGDGVDGSIAPTGTNNVRATYRVGGGTEGEVATAEIDTLLGSVRGVRSVLGAGPTSGGADQPTERDLRRQAPTRARAMERIVALGDAADLALAFPGVSHAAAWLGESPPGFACGLGPKVAVLRIGTDGVRAALPAELDAVSKHLDARRDVTIPLCVTSGEVVPVSLELTVAADPVWEAAVITSRIVDALGDVDAVLAATNRTMGQPLDRSDVVRLVHGVEGVVGIESLTVASATFDAATSSIGRLAAEHYQLLVPQPALIQVVFA